MNFMFEDFVKRENMVSNNHHVNSLQNRFQVCPMANTHLRMSSLQDIITHTNENYIIPVGVNGSIDQWTMGGGNDSLFVHLSEKYHKDLREGRAILLLDYSLEGYHTNWLFDWFHDQFDMYKIPPQSVIYTVGNRLIDSQYDEWADMSGVENRMKCIPYTGFEEFIYTVASKEPQVTVDHHLEYKKNNETWAFNCPQRRARIHRVEFFEKLKSYNLVERNLCSFPEKNHFILGEQHDKDSGYYINRIHPDYCLKTFLTVVSEPQYYENELSVFNSEKVFKPIACSHPFMVLGGKGSLQHLKERGYKTFSDYFDESYDTMNDDRRMEAIISTLIDIENIEDKVSWFESMRPVLEHNKKQLEVNSTKPDPAVIELQKYYKEYFNE